MAKHNDSLFKQRFMQKRKEDDAINAAYFANLGLTLMVLHDKFDFDPDKLEEFIDRYHELLDSYNNNYLSFDDVVKTLKEETGIKLGVDRALIIDR